MYLSRSRFLILFVASIAAISTHRAASAATDTRPSETCIGAQEIVNVDDDTGDVINVAAVFVPSGGTATCVTNPGVPVQLQGSGATLINQVQGLRVIVDGVGHTITNEGNLPFVLMNGDGSTINNRDGAIGGGVTDIGLTILGNDGTIDNDGTAVASGESSLALAIDGDGAVITNSGTAATDGKNSAAIAASGSNANIENSGTATSSGDEATAIFVEGNDAVVNNSGDAQATSATGSITGISVEGAAAEITNSGSVDVDAAADSGRSFGVTAVGDRAGLTNSGDISITANDGAGLGALGDDITLINSGTIETNRPPTPNNQVRNLNGASGIAAAGGRGADDQGVVILNTGDITTEGASAHGIEFGASEFDGNQLAPTEGRAANFGQIRTTGNDSDGIRAFAVNSEISNRERIIIDGERAQNAAAIRGTGNNLVLRNGSQQPDGRDATILARSGHIPANGGTNLSGIVLDGSSSLIENFGTIDVINNLGDGADDSGPLMFGAAILVRNPQERPEQTLPLPPIAEDTQIAGQTITGPRNTIVNRGSVAARLRSGALDQDGQPIFSEPTESGFSIFVDDGTAVIENLGGGELRNGIFFGDRTSGLVTNTGMIRDGILNAGQDFDTEIGPKALEINNQASGVILGTDRRRAAAIQFAETVILNNAGSIRHEESGTDTAVGLFAESVTVNNAGQIEGQLGISGKSVQVQNAGGAVIRSTTGDPALAMGRIDFDYPSGSSNDGPVENDSDPDVVTLLNAGTIDGLATAIAAESNREDLGVSITNESTGVISSQAVAIDLGIEDDQTSLKRADSVDNMGAIQGDVYLGAGDDTFIQHDEATLDGLVFGGLGQDALVAEFDGDGTLNGNQYFDFATLTKIGNGELEFDGTLLVDGTTVQDGSFLMQEGSSLVSSVLVEEGALIGGAEATVFGNITGDGTIAPGLSTGRLNVIGNVDSSGVFEFEIGGIDDFDTLLIDGDLSLDSTEFLFVLLDEFLLEDFDSVSFLDVSGNISGFDSSTFSFQGAPSGANFDVTAALSETGGFLFNLVSSPATSVPEPGTLVLLSIGLAGMRISRKRKVA